MFSKYFSRDIYYIKLRENLLIVKNVKSGEIYEDEPVMAIGNNNGKEIILDIGKQAHSLKTKKNVVIVNGFSHPRLIINDFNFAEKTLSHAILQVCKSLFTIISLSYCPPSIFIIHPMEKIEGGLNLIEQSALFELAAGVGASKAFIWVGRELTDDEIISRNYPLSFGTLFENRSYPWKQKT